MKRLAFVIVGLVLVALIGTTAVGINAGETPKKLRIIYTNDLTGKIEGCP